MPRTPKPSPAQTAVDPGSNFPTIRDKTVIAAAEEYFGLVQEEARIDARKRELKLMLLPAMNGAPTAFAGARVLSASTVHPVPSTPPRIISKEMLGQSIPGSKGRAGYTQLSVK